METIRYLVTKWDRRIIDPLAPQTITQEGLTVHRFILPGGGMQKYWELFLYDALPGLAVITADKQMNELSVPQGIEEWTDVTGVLTNDVLAHIIGSLPNPHPEPLHEYILEQLTPTAP